MITMQHEGSNGTGLLLVIVMFIIVSLFGLAMLENANGSGTDLVIDTSSHGFLRHGDDYVLVKLCLHNRGPTMTRTNPITNRQANVCQIEDDVWGLEICEGNGDSVTCFIKDKFRSMREVENYLDNTGYIE